MKANSNHHPTSFTKSHGKIWFNFNIVEFQKTDEHGTRTVYDYDYTEVTPENEAEIAVLAEKDGNLKEDLQEFKVSKEHNFKDFRAKRIDIV
ncbi:MAG: hypothetical protein HOI42_14915 [Candidatus Marinimicrobia bacterium]|jgi:hypothetical protein|nr:hypothetical protein [Candidatus Neomarinimicrobiota bacterium]MBT6218041.1 hypothetical protein [Candidatus Neomarinimicrobiota bacterium]